MARVADGGPDGHPHFVYRRQSIFPNNYYFYIRDPDWGPTFIKTIAYAPFPVWIYLNGNEWAKQQAAQHGIAFRRWITGSRPASTLRRSPRSATACPPRMSAPVLRSLQAALPSPLTQRGPPSRVCARARAPPTGDLRHPRSSTGPPRAAPGLRQRSPISSRSDAPIRPQSSSARASITRTPGRFHTKIFNRGIETAIQIHYRASRSSSTSKKAAPYRTETTINDTNDFGIGRLLTNANWRP